MPRHAGRLLLIFASCIFLAGCLTGGSSSPPPAAQSSAPPPEPLKPVKLDKTDIAAIEAGVRAGMKDPDSARIGKMVAGADAKGDYTVCLMVNAKNSYGGYTGEKPFVGMLLRDKRPYKFLLVPFEDRHAEFRDQATLKVCGDQGLAL